MAALDRISPDVINKLAKAVCAKLRVLGETNLESCGGVRAVAEVLNRVDLSTSEDILVSITSEDPALGGTIRQLMFVFEDLLRVTQDDLRVILGKLDRKILTLALKGCSPQVKKHFTGLLSSRAAEMLEEDLQALGPVRIRDVQAAQQQIIDEARTLQAEGRINLASSGSDEFVE
jgi:flagellar motor switch protein FliG